MIGSKRMLRLAHLGVVIAVTCCGVTATTAAAEELTLAWKRQPGKESSDGAYGVGTDAAGNVYLVGYTTISFSVNSDAWVAKYDPSGRLLWQRHPGTGAYDYAAAVAIDAGGNVYLAGRTEGSLGGANKGGVDAWVAKYDSSGQLLWQRHPGTDGDDRANSVATDAAGNVYVAGWTTGSLGGANKGLEDAWVAKYDPSGRLLWQRQPGTESWDEARGVATDAEGDIYVAGFTSGSLGGPFKDGFSDAWVAKYDPTGRLLWQRQPGTDGDDYANGVATDAAGNAFLVGSTNGSLGGPFKGGTGDAWVRKYDPAGRLLWQRQPGSEDWEAAQAVATDAAGNVYVAGMTEGSLGSAFKGYIDAWVAKYDSSGHLLWKRQPGTESWDEAQGVAADAAGNAYVVGFTYGSLGGARKGYFDAWVMKFSPTE